MDGIKAKMELTIDSQVLSLRKNDKIIVSPSHGALKQHKYTDTDTHSDSCII